MKFTPSEIEKAQQRFHNMKGNMRLKSIPIILLLVGLLGVRLLGEDHSYFLFVDAWIRNPNHKFAVMAFALAFIVYIAWIRLSWSCPHCKKSFGKQTNMNHCMHCGIPLLPQ